MKYVFLFICLFNTTIYGQNSFESFDKVKIAYQDSGGDGSAVVLIHGFISSGSSWNNSVVKATLIEEGFRVIIPDLRGNGASDRPKEGKYYADDAEVKDLMGLVDHLKLDNYEAVGYSRGAIVLSKLLVEDHRITKAVLGGMGLDFTNPDWERRIMFQQAFSGETSPNDMTSGAINYAKSIDADLQILGLLQEYQPVTSIQELSRINSKVLVIAGDKDKDNGSPQELSAKIPGSTCIIVPGGHNDTKNTKKFSEEVVYFLKE